MEVKGYLLSQLLRQRLKTIPGIHYYRNHTTIRLVFLPRPKGWPSGALVTYSLRAVLAEP